MHMVVGQGFQLPPKFNVPSNLTLIGIIIGSSLSGISTGPSLPSLFPFYPINSKSTFLLRAQPLTSQTCCSFEATKTKLFLPISKITSRPESRAQFYQIIDAAVVHNLTISQCSVLVSASCNLVQMYSLGS